MCQIIETVTNQDGSLSYSSAFLDVAKKELHRRFNARLSDRDPFQRAFSSVKLDKVAEHLRAYGY